jgi:bacillithiol biosynthesis cysteine-adding enzyme BshC
VRIREIAYPENYISAVLRKSAWGETPLGLYPHEGIQSNWSQIMTDLERGFSDEQRKELHQVLHRQHLGIAHAQQQVNIDRLLNQNAFVVTTGQQIHLGLGPMYVVYKIVSTIVLCNHLERQFPDKQFVPMFWMATEDHDFSEINYVDIFKDRYNWNKDSEGAVGAFGTDDLHDLFEWMEQKFQRNSDALLRIGQLRKIYLSPHQTLAKATAEWVSDLFGAFGLLVIDPNDLAFKRGAKGLFEQDLFEESLFNAFSDQANRMKTQGIEPPALARECNVFWMDEKRRRIVKTPQGFATVDGELNWSTDEMISVLNSDAIAHLSANVLLRPLYQQTILPCLAYVAGPTEYIYWLQTANAFEVSGRLIPALIHRKGGVILNASQAKKVDKLDVSPADLFLEESNLKDALLRKTLGENDLAVHAQAIEESLMAYLRVLYNWKSLELPEAKKHADAFLKGQKKMVNAAVNQHLEKLFDEPGWNGIRAVLLDAFNVKSPQERKMFFIQSFLDDGAAWLVPLCKESSYDEFSSFWMIES